MKRLKKKGMFFTLITIIFLFVFLFYFQAHSYQKYTPKMSVIEHRVNTINEFIKDVERDIERGLYISSFRSLLALDNYIITTGEFLDDVNLSFNEALINGTVNGASINIMIGSTISSWINNIKNQALKQNINVNIIPRNTVLYQKSPWTVTSGLNVSLFVSDGSGIASWNTSYYTEADVDITGFEDPLYIINTYGRLTNVFNQTIYEDDYVNGNDVSNLLEHLNKSFYTAHNDSPSFLMRFENNLNPSEYGIESLINLEELVEQGIPIEEMSAVDYIYWSNASANNYRINSTPGWFYLDDAHLEKYNVTGLSY